MCHDACSIFFLLKQCKIPQLILNSAKDPLAFVQDLLQLCSTILQFVTAAALQERVKKALHVSQ